MVKCIYGFIVPKYIKFCIFNFCILNFVSFLYQKLYRKDSHQLSSHFSIHEKATVRKSTWLFHWCENDWYFHEKETFPYRVEGTTKGPHLADWPRVFICMRGFRLLYELTVERHIRHGRRFAFQTVSEKAIVNDRWTSNGQHVLHTTAHKTYAYVSAAPERRLRGVPFVLTRRTRADRIGEECMCHICISFSLSPQENIPTTFRWKRRSHRVTPFLFLRFILLFIFSNLFLPFSSIFSHSFFSWSIKMKGLEVDEDPSQWNGS